MPELERLSISIEKPLLVRLERMVKESRYGNRSEFIRDLIRGRLVEQEWERDEEALGTITIIYNHHSRGLSERLTDLQHSYHGAILATTHVHLDHDRCSEMIMVRGKARFIRALADRIAGEKGVLHSALSISSTGVRLA